MLETPRTWRVLLGEIIAKPGEKERLAVKLEINPLTLERWVDGKNSPHLENLMRLVDAVPEYRAALLELLRKEFPSFAPLTQEEQEHPLEISSEFYARVFREHALMPEKLRFWMLGKLILEQALLQLDPRRQGLQLIVSLCLPPARGGKVRSLLLSMFFGTPPWDDERSQRGALIGAESLAGYVLSTRKPEGVIDDQEKEGTWIPFQRIPGGRSLIACPLYRAGAIAGCLAAVSVLPGYFNEHRTALFKRYAELLSIVFPPSQFYSPTDIELAFMPEIEAQQEQLATFSARLSELLKARAGDQDMLELPLAEQQIWQQFEAEFLNQDGVPVENER